MLSVFVSSEGISSSTRLGTDITGVTRGLNVVCLNMLKYVGFHFGHPETEQTLPHSLVGLLHFGPNEVVYI